MMEAPIHEPMLGRVLVQGMWGMHGQYFRVVLRTPGGREEVIRDGLSWADADKVAKELRAVQAGRIGWRVKR